MVESITNGICRDRFENEYPFEPHWFEVGGQRMHYIDEGTGDVLLMVHGNPTWSFAWRNLIKEFSKTHRVIAVDHMGCGFSDKPADYDYQLEQHIGNLEELIKHLDVSNITLIAHDWGGAIGMGVAGRNPERFARFCLMNTAAFRSKRIPLRIAVCRIPIFGSLAVRGLNGFARAAQTMAVENRQRITPAIRAGYLAPYNSWGNRIATHRFVEDIPLDASHPSYSELVRVEEGLKQFEDSPMLFVWGEKDWCFTTEFLDEFEQRFPQAETLRIPEAGHYVFEDAAEQLAGKLREFLTT